MTPEVALALDLARKKYGPNLQFALTQACGEMAAKKSHDPSQQKLTPEMARTAQEQIIQRLNGLPKGHKVHPRKAFSSGVENKRLGMGRVSPYYNAPHSDHFWFAGYDGKTMQEAIESQ